MGQSTSQPAVSHYNVVLTLCIRSYMILMKNCWDLNGKETKSFRDHIGSQRSVGLLYAGNVAAAVMSCS